MPEAIAQRSLQDVQAHLASCYSDLPARKQAGHACVIEGPDFHRAAAQWERERFADERQRAAVLRAGTGCGNMFLLGWAGNSPVRCGCTLTEVNGKKSTLQCPDCEAKANAHTNNI